MNRWYADMHICVQAGLTQTRISALPLRHLYIGKAMSSGNFQITKYQASYGLGTSIHPIRVQPETILAAVGAVTNAAPAGAVNNPIRASVSGSKNSNRLITRAIRIRANAAPPSGYAPFGVIRLPALTETFFNACTPGAVVSYLGVNWDVVSRSGEIPA